MDKLYSTYSSTQSVQENAMKKLSIAEAREGFAEVINKAAYAKERIIIERHGKKVAAMVPIEDLAILEAIENESDLLAARKALKEAKRKGTISLDKIKAELKLK